jgi:hypothetical protein
MYWEKTQLKKGMLGEWGKRKVLQVIMLVNPSGDGH